MPGTGCDLCHKKATLCHLCSSGWYCDKKKTTSQCNITQLLHKGLSTPSHMFIYEPECGYFIYFTSIICNNNITYLVPISLENISSLAQQNQRIKSYHKHHNLTHVQSKSHQQMDGTVKKLRRICSFIRQVY